MGCFQYLLFTVLIFLISFNNETFAQAESEGLNITIGSEIVDKNHALNPTYKPLDLIQIEQKWNYHGADYKKFLRVEVKEALIKMLQAAEKENIHIKVVSAFRSYQKQEQLYKRAIKKHGPNQNSTAKPGYSEHQLGTTVDLGTFDPATVLEQGFGQTKAGKWLKKNSNRFGFFQSYTVENSEQTGFIPEPWHYRYRGKPE